jgi:hypothetical protein
MLPLYGIKGVNGPSRGGRAGAPASMEEKGQLLDLFTLAECANYLANAGYGSV